LETTIPNTSVNVNGSGNARAIRILVVAHYASVRAGLHALLDGQSGIAVIGEARGPEEMDTALPSSGIDVLVYDLTEEYGGRVLAAAAGRVPAIVVLGEYTGVLSDLAEGPFTGWAYLNKEVGRDELSAAVRAVATGLIVVDHAALSELSFGPRNMAHSGL